VHRFQPSAQPFVHFSMHLVQPVTDAACTASCMHIVTSIVIRMLRVERLCTLCTVADTIQLSAAGLRHCAIAMGQVMRGMQRFAKRRHFV
jgi:hypothetical protein